jgi:hypothetical protein
MENRNSTRNQKSNNTIREQSDQAENRSMKRFIDSIIDTDRCAEDSGLDKEYLYEGATSYIIRLINRHTDNKQIRELVNTTELSALFEGMAIWRYLSTRDLIFDGLTPKEYIHLVLMRIQTLEDNYVNGYSELNCEEVDKEVNRLKKLIGSV